MNEFDQQELEKSLIPFPKIVREKLSQRILGNEAKCQGVIPKEEVQEILKILEKPLDEFMLSLLDLARLYARPPISNFYVGAVGLGKSGSLYLGANQEFMGEALNFSVHAEQCVTMNLWNHGEEALEKIAITDAPCGHCRQFLNELTSASTLQILLPKRSPYHLSDLLPDSFGPKDLGVEGGLLQKENHGLSLAHSRETPLIQKALEAANLSYAPYSKGYAGVAILMNDGEIYTGSYAENAAFNPSLSPMQAAAINVVLAKRSYDSIQRVVLVEVESSISSKVDVTQNLLKSITTNVGLEVQFAHS